jgi:hypothetical protein
MTTHSKEGITMDVQARVAARRAELARQQAQQQAEAKVAAAREKAEEQAQRVEILDDVAADMSTDTISVQRAGDRLTMKDATPRLVVDRSGLKASELDKLLNQEARKAWTPGENWWVIGCVVAGTLIVIPVPVVGCLLLFAGGAKWYHANKNHKEEMKRKYPEIFG